MTKAAKVSAPTDTAVVRKVAQAIFDCQGTSLHKSRDALATLKPGDMVGDELLLVRMWPEGDFDDIKPPTFTLPRPQSAEENRAAERMREQCLQACENAKWQEGHQLRHAIAAIRALEIK